jgi:ferredoxin-thioredoxin reductase catalytic chain
MRNKKITGKQIDKLLKKLEDDASSSGYNLNPDTAFTRKLVEGLLINLQRYGYQTCPCRLASGNKKEDLDIICPCDYRDPDLDEYGTCYCALYLSKEVKSGKKEIKYIPDRRHAKPDKSDKTGGIEGKDDLKYPVWRCRVCGYLCARDNPPEVCPVCKAEKERFEKFIKNR